MGVEPRDDDGSVGHERLGLILVQVWGVSMVFIEARAGKCSQVKRQVNNNTIRFNSKCSVLKILCTLARLYEGTPLQPLGLDFISHSL